MAALEKASGVNWGPGRGEMRPGRSGGGSEKAGETRPRFGAALPPLPAEFGAEVSCRPSWGGTEGVELPPVTGEDEGEGERPEGEARGRPLRALRPEEE